MRTFVFGAQVVSIPFLQLKVTYLGNNVYEKYMFKSAKLESESAEPITIIYLIWICLYIIKMFHCHSEYLFYD